MDNNHCIILSWLSEYTKQKMTDKEIIEALIARDATITKQFFFNDCRPLFMAIIRHIFSYQVDYEEFVNEFYLYLMENDSYRLKQFQGRSTLYQWIKVVAIRYFIAKRDHMIDMEPKDSLTESAGQTEIVDTEKVITARMDLEYLFSLMSNKRYVHVIKKLVLQDIEPNVVARELGTNVDNLYNIKKRAIAALTEIALKEVRKYGR